MEKSSKEEKVLQFCNSVFIFSNANDIMEKLYPLHIILHALNMTSQNSKTKACNLVFLSKYSSQFIPSKVVDESFKINPFVTFKFVLNLLLSS